jgi:para-nitrobenzyl esterase
MLVGMIVETAVETTRGRVEGRDDRGVQAFRGIPFAAPPVGPLRFLPPQPAEPWSGVRDAREFGPACPQKDDPVQARIWDFRGPYDEDCLTLNVWTPAADGARRPVMVWIHGGAFVVGGARRLVSEGHTLARRGDVVVVTVNYRLGAFGWLDLSECGPDFARSANLGLLDQIAALRWVRDNAERFGGDPDNVTVFGESAGGISVGVLLATAEAEGLFHRAIAQSGTASLVRSPVESRGRARAFLEAAGAESADDLRELDADQMVSIADRVSQDSPDLAFGPVADGALVAADPAAVASRIPLMHGYNLDEYRYWYMDNPRLETLRPEHLAGYLKDQGVTEPEKLVDAYRRCRPELSENEIAVALVGDAAFRMPHVRWAEQRAASEAPSWMYLFARKSPVDGGRLGAAHAMDVPFVFGTLEAPNVRDLVGAAPRSLSDQMQDAWLAFARTGDPKHEGLPDWPRYDLERRATLVFDEPSGVLNDPGADERVAWSAP